jgi:hypothetical protein
VTAAPPLPRLTARDRLAQVARTIEPILNRVVLAGPPVVDLLLTDETMRAPALSFAADHTLQLLSTSMVDRLGIDLQKLGLTRSGRAAHADRWVVSDQTAVDLVQVRSDSGDPAQLCLEYATLLTLPFSVSDRVVVRIAGAPAMLAMECTTFASRGVRPLDSPELERVILLIACRRELEREYTAAPPELVALVTPVLALLARNDSLALLIQRALPDAALLPALAHRVRDRIVRMAC